jgi:hypothetical protein
MSWYKQLVQVLSCLYIFLLSFIVACNQENLTKLSYEENVAITQTPIIAESTNTIAYPSIVTPTIIADWVITSTLTSTKVIRCDEPIHTTNPTAYVIDSIIPGQSTMQEVFELLGQPTRETEWEGKITWLYHSQESDNAVSFIDETVVERDAARGKLSEIVSHYGVPEQIIWQVPIVQSHNSVTRTYLLYPQHGTVFGVDRQVVELTPNTTFFASFVVDPTRFGQLLLDRSIYVEPPNNLHINSNYTILEWPCPS